MGSVWGSGDNRVLQVCHKALLWAQTLELAQCQKVLYYYQWNAHSLYSSPCGLPGSGEPRGPGWSHGGGVLGRAWEGRAWEEREVGLEELCFSKLKAFMEGFSPLHRILISVPLKTGIERCNPIWWSCLLAWGKGTKLLFSARRHRW